MKKITNEMKPHDPYFVAPLYTLPLVTNFVSLFATFCAIALIALGYISVHAPASEPKEGE